MDEKKKLVKTIELDCEPGGIRPGDLIEGVIKDTGLPLIEACAKFFGNWVYNYNDLVSDEAWLAIQPIVKQRVTELYHQGLIRYGSW